MDQHFDAERLAAFADGSLSSAERAAAEAHAADCPHCLQLLAAMARTHEEPPRPSRAGWRLPVFVRWAAPLAAAATALALWINLGPEPRQEQAPTSTEQAKASATQAAADEARSRVDSPRQPPPADLRKSEQQALPPARDNEKALPPPPREEKREAFSRADNKELDSTKPSAEFSPRLKAAKRAPEPAAPPSPAPTPGARTAETPPPPASASPAPTSAAAKPVSATPTAAEETLTSERAADKSVAGASGVRQRLAAVGAIEAVSPDRRYRWRVNGVVVERSRDAGATWVALSGMPGARILAIASPGPTTAWFVGRGGAVFVLSESNWARMTFPESIDLTAVRAVDAREAQVTTVDGRTFRTTDGGQTWSLQETPPPAF
jgi:Putative zinc-finger